MVEVVHLIELSFEERKGLPDGGPWLVFVGGFLQERHWSKEAALDAAAHFELFFL